MVNNSENNEKIVLFQKDLDYAKKLLPPHQYKIVLEGTQGEESEFFLQTIKNISKIAEESLQQRRNEDKTHPYTFEWQLNKSHWYMADWDGEDTAFGYTVLNDDIYNAEWGYFNISELVNLSSHTRIRGTDRKIPSYPEMMFHNHFNTIEQAVHSIYPELFVPEKQLQQSVSDTIEPEKPKPAIAEHTDESYLFKNNVFSARRNIEKNGLELRFYETMSDSLIKDVKYAGFRWSRKNQTWYTRWDGSENTSAKQFVNNLIVSSQKNDIPVLTKSPEQATIIYEENVLKSHENDAEIQEERDESSQSGEFETGQSQDNIRQIGRRNNRDYVSEHTGRADPPMGRNIGRDGSGTGYGNDFRGDRDETNNDSVPGGHISDPRNNDSSESIGLRNPDMQTGRLEAELYQHDDSIQSAGHGLTSDTLSKKDKRDIRSYCKELLASKTDEQITAEDKKILALYEGGGGLKEQNVSSAETLNAFYTPDNIIEAVWRLVDSYAPNAQTVLEPSCGIGKFVQNRNHNQCTLRELDETAARIARILHPEATVIQGAFQSQFFDSNGLVYNHHYTLPTYDIVIGNPPYGAYIGEWKGKGEGKNHTRYEEYFIDRGIDSLNENGILAFVVPSGFLKNTSNNTLKNELYKRAELLDAYRLPNGSFTTTDVGTDIIILKKRANKIEQIHENENLMLSDAFFKAYPDHILGEVKIRQGRFGSEEYIDFPDGMSLDDILENIHIPHIQYNTEQNELTAQNTEEEPPVQNQHIAAKSNIEKAFEWLPKENSLLSNASFIKNDFETGPENQIPFRSDFISILGFDSSAQKTIRNGLDTYYYTDLRIYIDIRTKDSILAYRNYIIAHADDKGLVKTTYNSQDSAYKELTAANKNNLNNVISEYTDEIQRFLHSYIGMEIDEKNTLHMYMRDYNPRESNIKNRYSCIDTNTKKRFSGKNIQIHFSAIGIDYNKLSQIDTESFSVAEITERINSSNEFTNEDEPIMFYASLEALYPENGLYNIEKIKEDNNFIQMSIETELQPLIEAHQQELQSMKKDGADYYELSYKNMETAQLLAPKYFAHMFDYIKTDKDTFITHAAKFITQEKENFQTYVKEITEKEYFEQDNKPLFDEILNKAFTPGVQFSVGYHKVKYSADPAQNGNVIVYINETKAFCINNARNNITTFNNFEVTSDFLHKMNERFGGELQIANIVDNEARLSLNAILEQKTVSPDKVHTAQKICTFMQDKTGFSTARQDELPQKTLNENGHTYKVVLNGNRTQLFIDASNYAACEFNAQANTLHLYQASYDNGLYKELENTYGKMYPDLSVIKDMTVDKIHYSDNNGNTVIVPYETNPYVPEKMKRMNIQEFNALYGKNWDERDRVFWQATNRKGYVDLQKLSSHELEQLHQSQNYMQETQGKFIHKELYTSGNIYNKLEQNELYFKQNLLDRVSYEKNKTALEHVIPKKIELNDISVSVISNFVSELKINDIPLKEQFVRWATGYDGSDNANAVNQRGYITDFTIAGVSRNDIPPTITWSDVVDYLDEREVQFKYDKAKTKEENQQIRAQKINDRKECAERLFKQYIHNYMTKEEQVIFVSEYNKQFNGKRSPDYSKLPLFIDGMNAYRKGKLFKLYEQQIKGIAFLCNKGNGLLAYDVGVGKTAAGIVAAVNQMQSGRAARPLIIVPQSVLGKWEADIHELFPDITVNMLGNFGKNKLARYYDGEHGLNIPADSISLASKECLTNIAFTKESIDNSLLYDYADILSLNDDLKSDNPKTRAEAREKIYQKAGMSNTVKNEDYILWEKTGFDTLVVDEAHAYKNLMRVPRPKKGQANEFSAMGSGEPSARALKMFNITQLIQKENDDRNVFMLTATPFTNSPLEIYSMLTYIARKELEENNIKDLYDFCKAYAKTRLEMSVNPKGDIQEKSVMKEFNDLNGLQNILTQYIDKVDAEEAKIIRPEKKTHVLKLEPSDLQKEIFDFAIKTVMEHKPEPGQQDASMLRGMHILRTAALSPALLKDTQLIDPETNTISGIVIPPIEEVVDCSPKLKHVCDTVVENWKAQSQCGQIIYIPQGTESYPHIINYMIKKGVPIEVFATIDGSNATIGGKKVSGSNDVARETVSQAFNDTKNKCKILVGSSAISEGMDLNGNTIAVYNCMLGWNPSEAIQVEGRAWRQGNQQGRVHIVYPLVEDSIDSFLYQKHDEKGHRTNQLFSYKGSTLDVSDIDPETIKFELIKDPLKRASMEIAEIKKSYQKELLMFEYQLKDYDGLLNAQIRLDETLQKRKQDKETYIANYQADLFKGTERRSAEAQEKGIARYDAAIKGCQVQLENITRKLKEMGIETFDKQQDFSRIIMQKKEGVEKKIEKLTSREHIEALVKKYEEKLEKERIERLEQQITKPLHEDILSDLIPFHEHEYRVKKERYENAMKSASSEEQNILTEEYNRYLEDYEKEYGKCKESTPISIEKTNLLVKKTDISKEEQINIVKIISHTAQTFERQWQKDNQPVQIDLFTQIEESPERKHVQNISRPYQTASDTTCTNFQERLQNICRTKTSPALVMQAASSLIKTMSDSELKQFKSLIVKNGCRDEITTQNVFISLAKGNMQLMKEQVCSPKKEQEHEYDIY